MNKNHEVKKEINVRTLLRDFKKIKESLINRSVEVYGIPVENSIKLEIKVSNKSKGNIAEILNSAKRLPKATNFKRPELGELFSESSWKE